MKNSDRLTRLPALLAAIAAVVSLCASAHAQSMFGRISGTVTDASSAAVSGAKVTVTNTETQSLRTLTTDDRGFFVAENLSIGPYSVAIDHPGFKRVSQSGFTVTADGRVTADFILQVGDTSQSIEVSASQVEQLNTVSGEIAHVVDRQQIDNLSLNGRNYMELLSLVPGAVVTNPDSFSVMTTLSATNQAVNGHRTNSNNMTVDGLNNLDGGANGSLINNISPDFTQEVKIQTSNFSSEYGRSAGAAFNVVTRNGTNQFHGMGIEYFRNDKLDARNFFAADKTPLRFNDFGWSLGGPIKKNKIFFFAGEEWKKLRQQSAPVRETLPDTAILSGNFAGSGKTVLLPGTKTPYPGNIIPASQITPDGIAIANVYKFGISQASSFTDANVANNATFQTPNPLDYREDIVRLDYKISDKHSLYGRWVDDQNSIYLAYGPSTTTGTYLPVPAEIRSRPARSALVSETWLISSNLINEFHAGASWNGQRYINQGNAWERSTYGFKYQTVYSGVGAWAGGIPSVNVQNFAQWKGPDQTLSSPTTNIEVSDTVSIVKGQHSIRTGVQILRNRKDQNGRSAYNGAIVYNTSGNPNTTGYAIADALTGYFQTYTEAAYDPVGHYRYTEPGAFVDDSWKVSRKLTINLGVRWEYMMAMYSAADNLANFVPSLYNPATAVKINSSGQVIAGSGNIYDGLQRVASGVNPSLAYLVPNANNPAIVAVPAGGPRGLYPNHNTFSPRVGFAYALDEKTVIRGGFGLYYDRIQGNPTFYTLNNPPYVGSTQFQYGNLSNIAGGATVNAPWGTLQTIDPNLKVPYSEQFSLSIQRQLPWKIFSETAYVGSLGRHLLTEPDINQPTWAALGAAASTTNINTLRPYAGYSTIQQFQSVGNSNYHSLQLKASRRAGAVMFTASYTFAKNLCDAPSDTQNDFNVYNRKAVYGPCYSSNSGASVDVRHAFVSTVTYDLPGLKGRPAYLRMPFGGWQLSAISRLQSGFYFTIIGSTPILGTRVADYLGGNVILPNPGPNAYINPAAFAVAPQNRFGSSGTGNVEGPGLQLNNFSVTRFFRAGQDGKYTLRFRADFNNIFNHTNFQPFASGSLTVGNSSFGTLTSAYPARAIQLGLKLTF